jgi:hypothetical protein
MESYRGQAELRTPDGQPVTKLGLILEAGPDQLPRVVSLSAHNPAALRVGEEYVLVIPGRGSLRVKAGRSGTPGPGFYGRWILEVLSEA